VTEEVMIKILLIILIQALLVSCVQEIKEAVSEKKEKSGKTTSAIEGSVSAILNVFISQAHAGNILLCQSEKSSGSNVYAKLHGVKADGSKEEVCETDIVNGYYRFDITKRSFKYKGLVVEVIDNRSTGNKQFEGRKAIIDINSSVVDITPETSIVSEFIDHLYIADIFGDSDPEQRLIDKKNDLSISKIRTILPDIFVDGATADNSSLEKTKSFFSTKKNNSTIIDAIKSEVVKSSPAPLSSSTLGNMCDINIKSSFSCYKISETCFDDYEVNWNDYAGIGYASGMDVSSAEILAQPSLTSPACVEDLVKVTNFHLNQTKYLNSSLDCSNYFDGNGQPLTSIVDEQDTSECNWDKGFYLYVHGSDGVDQCLAFDQDTCMDPTSPNFNPGSMLCQTISLGGCMPDM